MCFDESATQSNNMPKLTFTIPMKRRLARLRTAEPPDALGIEQRDQQPTLIFETNGFIILLVQFLLGNYNF